MLIKLARIVSLIVAIGALVLVIFGRGDWGRYWAEQDIYTEAVAIASELGHDKELLVRSRPTDCTLHSIRWTKEQAQAELGGLTEDTLRDFLKSNGEHASTTYFWKLRNEAEILDDGDIRQFAPQTPYGTFSLIGFVPIHNYFISLSRVGFDPSMKQALVCAEMVNNRVSGVGTLMLFSKSEKKWKLSQMMVTW